MSRGFLSDQDRQRVLFDWNRVTADYPRDRCLHHLVEDQAALRPDAVAVRCGEAQLTYRQLNGRANQLARFLSAQGVRPGVLVALCVQRSFDMVVAILGIMKAGGAYVPISPAYPAERIAFMLSDAQAPLLLTQECLAGSLPAFTGKVYCLDSAELMAAQSLLCEDNPQFPVRATDVAYVIYTSGSTGTPKGVLVEHRGTYNTALAHIDWCGVRPEDRLLQFAAFSFDTSILEMLMAFGAGATLVLVPQDQPLVGEALGRLLSAAEITMATLQPSILASLPDCQLPALRTLLSAGEACTRALVARWAPGREFWNAYGPTEASVCVTLGRCTTDDGAPAIGRPLPNTRIYILDESGQPVAIGEPGEIYIGGVTVARGYLNRPELTAERFLPDPFSPDEGSRMYRTGDLARFRTDGRIDFLGRVDHQVKLRGFRIELGEIEAALLRHPGVRHAVVMAREDEPGNRRLVAYVVPHPGTAFSVGLLREFLKVSLPEFMIPSAFVSLPVLPLTTHGKVDRAALPPPGQARPALSSDYVAPTSETERQLAAIFAAILRLDEIGVHDDFFELGGHSLLAALAAAQIASRLQVELPLRALFVHRTVAALAKLIDGAARTKRSSISRRDPSQPPPLSFSQQQVWLTSQLDAQCPLYNEPYALHIRGPLDAAALEEAFRGLLERHEILRTAFEIVSGAPVQRIHPSARFSLERHDLRGVKLEARAAAARRLHDELAQRPFDLETPPLLRAALLQLAEDEHRLLLVLHHAIFDGVSLNNVLLAELVQRYRSRIAGEPFSPPPPALQYADYAAWERGQLTLEVLSPQVEYWRHKLMGLPVLQLPTDHPRTAQGGFRGARHPVRLSAEVANQLTALAQREGTTLYTALLSAFSVLLNRYTGQEDIPIAGVVSVQERPELGQLIGQLIGPFTNTVVARVDLSVPDAAASTKGLTFLELLRRVRETVLAALEHRELPFEKLVEALRPERRLGQHPLFQVLFLLDPPGPELLPGWSLTRFEAHNGTSMCDLSLQLERQPDGLHGFLEYNTDLFESATIARWAQHLEILVSSLLAAPNAPVGELPLLPASEQAKLAGWGAGAKQFEVSACLHELFAERARRTPDAVALVYEDTRLTYAELEQRASQLCRRLRALDIGSNPLIGLYTERSPELVIGILGILKAGGAYVPLDPVYPRERIRFLLEDTAAPVVVTQEKLRRSLPPSYTGAVLCVDDASQEASHSATAAQEDMAADPDRLAYVIYTSGSTGKPKGVQVSHRNVVRLFLATDQWFHFSASDVWCLFHSFAFDFSVWELWGALLYGGRLVLVPYWVSRSPEAFYRLLCSESVTVLNQTPSAFYQLIQVEPQAQPACDKALGLRWVIFGGEALDLASLRPWFERHGDEVPHLVNMYGITETTVHVTFHPIVRADCDHPGSVIGVPIPDLRIRVLDRRLQPVPIGIPGELFVGGAGVAAGYLNRPALTAERFFQDPYGAKGERLYRSGDWARYRADGELEYLGRIDQQIKIRGFRVELGEIEEILMQHPALQAAVVVLREDTPGDKRLVSYIVPKSSESSSGLAGRVRSFAEQKLPSYMMPAHIVPLDSLPLTQNGKLDRRALPAPDHARPELRAEYVAPRTFLEEELCAIFSEVLGVEQVGVNDNFFELGGHSLLVIRASFRVREVFHIELPMRAIFEAPTVAGLSRHLETLQPGRRGLAVPPIVPMRHEGRLPLSFAQQRLWFLGQLLPDAPSYNEPVTIRFRGAVDTAALERSLGEILRRHEAWRTTFAAQDGEPFQVIHPPSPLELPVVDLRGLSAELRESEFLSRCTDEAHRPFNLVEGPLVRFLLLRLSDQDARLFMTFHHIVADGLSIYSVFSVELSKLYRAFSAGQPSPLPELPIQYSDFALWQRRWLSSEAIERQLTYWRQQLGRQLPKLQLPVDHAPPEQPTFRGARQLISLPLELTQRLRRLGHREGATLFITLLTGLKALLYRYIEQQDVVIGIVTAGRQRPELAPLVGFFPNTLVLRTQMAGDPSFRALLQRVREVTLQAFDNQDVPFERVVEAINPERRPGETPLFRVAFILDPLSPELGNDWAMTSLDIEIGAAKFDLSLELVEVPQGVVGRIGYRTELFRADTIERMAGHYITLLENAAKEPDLPLLQLEILTKSERAQILRWSMPAAPFPDGVCAHRLFEEQVDRTPDAPALRFRGENLSYRVLDEQANRVAHALLARGVRPNEVIGLCIERSPQLIIGLLGILKAGAGFLSLDSAYPPDRLAFMIHDAEVKLVLTERALMNRALTSEQEVLLLDEESWQQAHSVERPAETATSRDLAYVIYTSGSTGRPKGALIEHRSLCNLAANQVERFHIGAGDRVLQLASLSFDAAIWEIMVALISGATLVLAPREELLPGPELFALLERERVTTMMITPSALALVPCTPLPELRTLVSVGEALPAGLIERWVDGTTRTCIHNGYGPSETTILTTVADCRPDDDPPPIGPPLTNAQAFILSPKLQLMPQGMVGEIYIGGVGLTRGYLRRPELNTERFVASPFSDEPAVRLYHSGDLGRWRSDGQIEFLGRLDTQVKLRGQRIELGEIEAVLCSHPEVKEAAVIARFEGNEQQLVAFVIPVQSSPAVSALRSHLGKVLPQYMIPAVFVTLAELPRTLSGKTDRRALAETVPSQPPTETEYVPPESGVERTLSSVWREVLHVERVGVEDNFFDLGGHSLRMAQVHARLREVLGREVPMLVLFRYPTIRALAAFLQGDEETDKPSVSQERGRLRKEAAAMQRQRAQGRKKRDE